VNLKVPFGCSATLYLTENYKDTLCEGEKKVCDLYETGVNVTGRGNEFYINIPSGEYTFEA